MCRFWKQRVTDIIPGRIVARPQAKARTSQLPGSAQKSVIDWQKLQLLLLPLQLQSKCLRGAQGVQHQGSGVGLQLITSSTRRHSN